MILCATKLSMVFAVAVFYTFVVLNNLMDYNSNYQFVRHVLMMDSTFPGSRGMWRALDAATLGLALLMWLVAFLSVGGEWFPMWQSRTSNGQGAAFRMFAVIGIVLLLLALPDSDTQP